MRVTLATAAGTAGWPNEDFAAVAPGAAVLLDGATTFPRDADTGCVHGVAWYARTLGTTLLAAIAGGVDIPLADGLASAISDVRALHEGTCDLSNPATPAATVTAVRAEPGHLSYLCLSDSTVAANFSDGRPPLIITDTHPAAKAAPGAAVKAQTGTIPLDGLRELALLSDGATRITDRYELLSWTGLLDLIRDDGPTALISSVREAEAADPAGERWPRSKINDDATVLWWDIADGQ